MIRYLLAFIAAIASVVAAAPSFAEEGQFLPHLVYRTGPYAVNGAPYANGVADYWNMINERDGGINGVKIIYEECENGYSTARGVECYERLKAKGSTGAGYYSPMSTGMTFAFTAKAWDDKIPILTPGYGRSEMEDGTVFKWNFPITGTHWTAADVAIQHISKELGGDANLKGKKIALVYNDSPYGRDPITLLKARAKKMGFTFLPIPVTHPGIEQKSQWLRIRREKPDYVLLWGWGIMNSTSLQEAAAVQYPREKMIGTWWSGAEEDVIPAGEKAIGFKAVIMQPTGRFPVHADILKYVYAKGKGAAKEAEVGRIRYNRGIMNSMFGVEAIRTAQKKFGNKPLTGEQIQWGFEHLNLSATRIKELGFEGMLEPIKLSCSDHIGNRRARVQDWDGKAWKIISEWYTGDATVLDPLVKKAALQYAKENKITVRNCPN